MPFYTQKNRLSFVLNIFLYDLANALNNYYSLAFFVGTPFPVIRVGVKVKSKVRKYQQEEELSKPS